LPHIDALYPSFGALIRRIGSRQIRNLGTLAGNIANASPIGDTIPCLMALSSTIGVRSATDARLLLVSDFITGYRKTALRPGEFVETISIPKPQPNETFAAYKISKRFDQDISAVVAAFVLRVDGGKIASIRAAYGGMAAQASRAYTLEAALAGRNWTLERLDDLESLLAQDYTPADDHRASAAYRLTVAANLVRRLFLETTGGDPVRLETL
jgi:xanthine dehydrogenase small subunit